MKGKTLLKGAGLTLGGFVLLAVVLMLLMQFVSSGPENATHFAQWAKQVSGPLIFFRIIVYAIIATVGVKCWFLYKQRGDEDGMERVKRMMLCFAVVVAFLELPALLPD